jgi:alkylhydroperoxidase/carboxymuconolactone decarboxylase family protein
MAGYYHSEDLARFGEIAKSAPPQWETFFKWYTTTMEPGTVDGKTKKLAALAVAYAIQEPYCIDAYTSACVDAGISPEEMAEIVNVAAVIRGGGTLAHWAHTQNTLARKK